MYKKTVKYTDYEGNQQQDDLYFHLNKAEVVKWLTTTGDYTLDKLLMKLTEEKNGKELINIFDDLIMRSYGKKSLDGKRFEKSSDALEEFKCSEAYSTFFMEVIGDAKAATEFINGIMPSDLADEVAKVMKENPDGIPDSLKDYMPKER